MTCRVGKAPSQEQLDAWRKDAERTVEEAKRVNEDWYERNGLNSPMNRPGILIGLMSGAKLHWVNSCPCDKCVAKRVFEGIESGT